MVSGTLNNIPTVPNNQPQNISDKNTTNVDKPKPLPRYLGSIILPITILMKTKPKPIAPASPIPNCRIAKVIGGTEAIIEPMLGI